MQIDLEPKSIGTFRTGSTLQQSSYWGQVKKIQGWNSKAFNIKFKSTGENQLIFSEDLLIVSRKISEREEISYIPYGPNHLPDTIHRGALLEELSENLRGFLSPKCILIRYDLPWASPWLEEQDRYDEEGKWLGPPEPRIREFRMNIGTHEWRLRKSPSDNLPSSTFFIDLQKSEGELLSSMKSKTRYNIHLAKRKGVNVREASSGELPLWYDLYCQTAKRNGINLHHYDYFNSLLYANKESENKDTRICFLIAEAEGKALASMFLAIAGRKATYLYGASSNENRNYMAPYLLQWEAICKAKKAGCIQYDMFGVSHLPDPSHPMYGLYRFKSGFGGRFFHRQGCWDYVLNEKLYQNYLYSEITEIGYHL